MKKWISLLLALLLPASLGISALTEAPDGAESAAFAGCGMAFMLPEGMQNLEGTLRAENTSVLDELYCVDFLYYALPEDRLAELERKVIDEQTGTPEEVREFFDAGCSVCSLYCAGGKRDFSAVIDACRENLNSELGLRAENAVKLAQIGDYSFYLYKARSSAAGTTLEGGAYAEEYGRVLACVDELADGMTFTKPFAALAEKYAPAMKMLEAMKTAGDTEAAPAAESVETETPVEAAEPAAEEKDAAEMPAAVPNGLKVYRVHVTDGAGPVEKVTVQFCSDTACMIGKTDAYGYAVFEEPVGAVYTVHILKTPKGYEKQTAEYETLYEYSDVEVVLSKAAE